MAGLIEQDAPRARLAALLQHFSDLDDSREPWRVMYPLREVLLLVTCATIASCDDFDEIADWGEHNIDFLRRFSDYHHGIPCERWLRSLFNRVDPTLFARCFENWVAAQWPGRHEFIAIDGKTARRSHDRRKGLKALHTLSAYATTARLTLAQLSVPEKTNEITAIPPSRICSITSPRPTSWKGRWSASMPWVAKSTSPKRSWPTRPIICSPSKAISPTSKPRSPTISTTPPTPNSSLRPLSKRATAASRHAPILPPLETDSASPPSRT